MISLLPRRLHTANPREGHRPGGGVGGLGLPGRYRPDAVLLTLAAMGIEGGVAIGTAVVTESAGLPGSGLDRRIEAMTSIIVIRRFIGARLSSAPRPSGAPRPPRREPRRRFAGAAFPSPAPGSGAGVASRSARRRCPGITASPRRRSRWRDCDLAKRAHMGQSPRYSQPVTRSHSGDSPGTTRQRP